MHMHRAPACGVVPAADTVLLEDGIEVNVRYRLQGMLSGQPKPLATLAPVQGHLHSHVWMESVVAGVLHQNTLYTNHLCTRS